MPLLMLLAFSLPALAQQERLEAPGASLSAEDGAAALRVNPANLGFDPDPALGLWFEQGLTDLDSSVALATSAGGTGLGLLYRDDETGSWWTFSSAVSAKLWDNLRAGATLNWNVPDGPGNNFTSWDVGLGYRPLPFLGFGGALRSIGNPGPQHGVFGHYALSATVRPLEDKLELSIDYSAADPSAEDVLARTQTLSAVLRARPVEGLVLRARADTDPLLNSWSVGGGLEVWFGAVGGGAWVGDSGGTAQAYLGTTVGQDRLFGAARRVPVVALDRSRAYQPQAVLFGSSGESYLRLLERLREAAEDKSVQGMVVELSGNSFSSAQLMELRSAVKRMQAEGKPVIAYLNGGPGNGTYMLASACDKVLLHPAGEVGLIGMSAELQYFRGALDMVGVQPQYARRSEYKSAPEQFLNTEPSGPSREQMDALLDDLSDNLRDTIAEGRSMDTEQVKSLIDGGPYTGKEAVALGLVDALVYPEDLEEELESMFPRSPDLDDSYLTMADNSGWRAARQVAVIYIEGPITGGETRGPGFFGGGANSGSATVRRALDQAAASSTVKAVVLRVDSPGGSAFASDEIWRAVESVKAEGKPVIVSFGGVAASGGYYVAAGADVIFAEPTTVTGSIGVYGGKFSFGELYEKVGVSSELFLRGRNAGMYSTSRAMDKVEMAAMERMISDTYLQFKERVADGREMNLEEVEQVARGRVWSGVDAKEVGLVDELGGFQDAIQRARREAGIADGRSVQVVAFRGRDDSLGEVITEGVQSRLQPTVQLPPQLQAWAAYAPLADEHVLMVLPWQMTIH